MSVFRPMTADEPAAADAATFWARREAQRLLGLGLSNADYAFHSRAQSVAAIEFLRLQAPNSHFHQTAVALFDQGSGLDAPDAYRQLAQVLDDWANFVDAGWTTQVPYAARARVDAATDLLEQVQTLLDDSRVHPAAPVVLAGAALEELLRSLVVTHAAEVKGRPGLTTYATALQVAEVLSAQDVKDVIAWAGQRNQAAHGQFDELTRQRAQIMVESINLFMRQRSPLS